MELESAQYWHGTSASSAVCIAVEGFRLLDPQLRIWGRGALGNGIYVTKSLDEALSFGSLQGDSDSTFLLRLRLQAGTRIARFEDGNGIDLDALRRNFGHEILGRDFGKAIPSNKKLKPRELFAILAQLDRKREFDGPAIAHARRWLRRLGYDACGHNKNDLGVAVFDPLRLSLESILVENERGAWVEAPPQQLLAEARKDLEACMRDIQRQLERLASLRKNERSGLHLTELELNELSKRHTLITKFAAQHP